ncbi:MAG: hypothetical protein RID42_10585 [Alphaproteobacteria bacterium]
MSDADYRTMVLLTYTPGTDVERLGYDEWLREIDNPFFNTIPGIAHYSNWKVLEGGDDLPFTHFDLLGLDGPEAVEPVWFNQELDRFRSGWVAKWGYGGSAPPTASNGYGLLATRQRAGAPFNRYARVAFDRDLAEGAHWTIDAALHKHWALGQLPPGTDWRLPVSMSPFGASIGLDFSDNRPAGTDDAFVGTCIAAPHMPRR